MVIATIMVTITITIITIRADTIIFTANPVDITGHTTRNHSIIITTIPPRFMSPPLK